MAGPASAAAATAAAAAAAVAGSSSARGRMRWPAVVLETGCLFNPKAGHACMPCCCLSLDEQHCYCQVKHQQRDFASRKVGKDLEHAHLRRPPRRFPLVTGTASWARLQASRTGQLSW